MTARHWAWTAAALTAWAVLAVLWATTPSVCSLPEAHPSAHCQATR